MITVNDERRANKLPVRKLLITGVTIQLAALLTMGGLGTVHNPSPQIQTAIVAMVTIFLCGFSFGWAPLTYVVMTEVPALHLRDASQRTASIVNVIFK
jgi:MFS transporter, SP family, sugar:H+ symporter